MLIGFCVVPEPASLLLARLGMLTCFGTRLTPSALHAKTEPHVERASPTAKRTGASSDRPSFEGFRGGAGAVMICKSMYPSGLTGVRVRTAMASAKRTS